MFLSHHTGPSACPLGYFGSPSCRRECNRPEMLHPHRTSYTALLR